MNISQWINFSYIGEFIKNYIPYNRPVDIIRMLVDIGIVSFIIYKLVQLVRETRAWQLLKGILVILITALISSWLQLSTLTYLLNKTIELAGFALIVLFQPELRRGLEQIGRSKFKDFINFDEEPDAIPIHHVIDELVSATHELSRTKTGALIVIEKETKLGEIISKGINLDSSISSELIKNIFTPNTPLHDGAVIIRENRINAAGCVLPLTENQSLSKELGTRHRAALGVSEVSDAIAVVVSEETGNISIAKNGTLIRNLGAESLRANLSRLLIDKVNTGVKFSLRKVRMK
jgi:diadenylate cyclase